MVLVFNLYERLQDKGERDKRCGIFEDWSDLHKRIVQAHHSDNQRIHTQGKNHQYSIKLNQGLVFLQAIAHKLAVYRFHKVEV